MLISRIRNFLYDHGVFKIRRAPLPVISVGNISLGGTEKTPLAMDILGRLLEQGRRPALVSRGYRGRWEKDGGVLSEGRGLLGTWEEGGDEPYLVARSTPFAGVFVGKDRLSSCLRAAAAGFDVAILDDGFQHRGLARDLDIVLYSPGDRIALREPRSALSRANLLLIKAGKRSDKTSARLKGSGTKMMSYSVVPLGLVDLWTNEDVSPDRLAQKNLLAFCGIARPVRFLDELQRMGYKVVSFLPYPDHHPYPRRSLERVVQACRRAGAEALVTTEKDGLKISGRRTELAGIPTYMLRIGLALEPGFDELLMDFSKMHPAV